MAVTITNESSQIKLTRGNHTHWIPKPFSVRFNSDKDRITIIPDPKSGEISRCGELMFYFTDVTSPSAVNASALAEALAAYNNQSSSGTFTNSDLSSGVLTIDHSLKTSNVVVVVRDPDGTDDIVNSTVVDTDTVTVDFGGSIASGTWTWFVLTK